MNKWLLYAVVGIATLVGASFLFSSTSKESIPFTANYKDAAYRIDGRVIQLNGGVSEIEAAPNSASRITTRYFGNEVQDDLDGDGRDDVVFLLTQETGGSGTFYYVVAALNTVRGYMGSEALLLGDRIAPQTTELSQNPSHKNVIVVNYVDRAPGESMTAQPSIGKSIWLKLDPETMQFGEVVQNFEGEADPARMKLTMKKWIWVDTIYNDERNITPKQPGKFTLSFSSDRAFSVTTDCNTVGGTYTERGNVLSFGQMMSTLMYCEGSQESEFTQSLSDATGFRFTSKGELILNLASGGGYMIFR